jgi:hypothetical protein
MRRNVLFLSALVMAFTAACGGGSDESAVEIGPGSSEEAPAVALIGEEAGEEPSWVAEVPAPADPSRTRRERMAALNIAASASLDIPDFDDGDDTPTETTTDTTETADGETAEYPYGDFSGAMTIDIAYYNYCVTYDGNLAFAGEGTYESAVDVSINEQADNDGVTERSPFNLLVTSEPGVEGSIVVWSAQVMTDPSDQRSALFDYWRIEEDDGELTGVLTDRWPGVAFNEITTAQPLIPCTDGMTLVLPDDIAEGAELTGTVVGDAVDLEILGQSLDREVRFRARIHAEPTDD